MTPAGNPATDAPAGQWAALAKICLGIIFAMTPWFSATAILPELRQHWEFSAFLAAMMTNGVQVGFVVGALAASFTGLPDIVPIRRLMAGAAIAAGLLNLALLVAPGPEVAVMLRVLTGIALALVYPPAMKLVTTWFIRGRGIALGLVIGLSAFDPRGDGVGRLAAGGRADVHPQHHCRTDLRSAGDRGAERQSACEIQPCPDRNHPA